MPCTLRALSADSDGMFPQDWYGRLVCFSLPAGRAIFPVQRGSAWRGFAISGISLLRPIQPREVESSTLISLATSMLVAMTLCFLRFNPGPLAR